MRKILQFARGPGIDSPANYAENHTFGGKITFGFWLLSTPTHLISSTIGPCDKNQLILCSNGCFVVSNAVTPTPHIKKLLKKPVPAGHWGTN